MMKSLTLAALVLASAAAKPSDAPVQNPEQRGLMINSAKSLVGLPLSPLPGVPRGYQTPRPLAEFDMTGDWVLSRGTLIDASIKATFRKDGTFEFRSSNAISKGKFSLAGHSLTLVWTEVDGDRVADGQMKKTLLVEDGGSAFYVDRWRYIRKP